MSRFVELRRLAVHIQRLPDEAVDLDRYVTRDGSDPKCGTVACAIGHACLSDEFPEFSWTDCGPSFKGAARFDEHGDSMGWDERAAAHFGISYDEFWEIFRTCYELPWRHKDIFLQRVNTLLLSKGEPAL